MDRDGANFYRSLESIHKKLGANAIPIQIPICIGNEDNFIGVVDLISMRKFIWSSSSQSVSSSPSSSRIALPPIITTLSLKGKDNDDDDDDDHSYNELYHQALKQRHVLFEALADADEIFMELYLQSNETDYSPDSVSSSGNYNDGDGDDDTDHSDIKKITTKDILSALRRCCLTNTIVPTLCGASLRCKGIEPLLDSILTFLPNPLEIKPLQAIHTNESSSSSSMKSSSSISSTKPSVSSSTATALKSIHPITDKDLCALAFKVTHDALRGPLVYVRVFSGSISSKQTLYNSTKGESYGVVMMMVTISMNMIL
jgi:elongation factor G